MIILATGLSGLVGTRIAGLLPQYSFIDLSRKTGIDITNRDEVRKKIFETEADYILHLAAKTDVDGCEKERDLGTESEAWKINVEGTRNVVGAASEKDIPVIYFSTEFVFDGEKPVGELYREEDTPNPVNFYAQTKYEGEKIVQENQKNIILRIAYPYRAQFEKNDFVRAILSRLKNNQPIAAITDHTMTPTFIDDIALALDVLFQKKESGIYHAVGNQRLSPYEAAMTIAETFSCDRNLISETTRAQFFKDRAVRPFNLGISNDKITELGAHMHTFKEGLQTIKQQLEGELLV